MKHLLIITTTLLLTQGVASAASDIREKQVWSKTYAVQNQAPRLEISNIWGGVRVRTGNSGEIVVAVEEVRSAPNRKLFDRSLAALKLNIEADNSGLIMRVGDPEQRWDKKHHCRDCRVDVQFDILVPADAIIDVGTVMDGLVDVSGVTGIVSASNVNGSIKVSDIHNCDMVVSVNGRVDVGFSKAPTRDCSVETINGDITLKIPAETNLAVAIDLFNGEVESEFPVQPFALPATVERDEKDGRKRFRIRQLAGIRIGSNGPVYSIASMNGDVHILKNQ